MPAIEELKRFTTDDAVRAMVNRTLAERGGTRLYNKKEPGCYWSSTEGNEFCMLCIGMNNGKITYGDKDFDSYYVRAVAAF